MPTNKSYAKLPYIPIMFKAYPGGKFTAKMVKGPVEKVVISESKGEGLQLSHTKPGKIVMVIGGTGLYPFSDFIDLLYKEQLMIHKPETRNEVLELSPVLSSNPFSKFQFEVLAAFNHAEDIHPVTLEQLLFLAEAGRVNLIFKFKEDTQGRVKEGRNVSLTSQSFQSILEQRLSKEEVSRVWICGPPRMNEGVSQYLREKVNFDSYLIV